MNRPNVQVEEDGVIFFEEDGIEEQHKDEGHYSAHLSSQPDEWGDPLNPIPFCKHVDYLEILLHCLPYCSPLPTSDGG